MDEVLSIEQIKQLAQPTIEIPGFNDGQVLKIKVQKPNIMSLLIHGKMPNHLLSTVNKMITGKSSKKEKSDDASRAKEVAKLYELYCEICMVKPTYQQMKDIITDEQMETIFLWATKEVKSLDSFRKDQENGQGDNDGQELQKKAK